MNKQYQKAVMYLINESLGRGKLEDQCGSLIEILMQNEEMRSAGLELSIDHGVHLFLSFAMVAKRNKG